jgi:hypothetical protein
MTNLWIHYRHGNKDDQSLPWRHGFWANHWLPDL